MEKAVLRELVGAGAVLSATARGVPGGYVLLVNTEVGERLLTRQRGQARVFSRLETVASFLRDIGLNRFAVDTEAWAPDGLV
jgi:hypothetical protein